ncbi:MAG: NUDIX domain-containing protein [Caulobacteraceae bacterium]
MGPSIVEQSVVHDGWGRFLLLKVALADGTVLDRQLEDHGCAAVVLAYDPDRRTALMVRLARVGPLYMGEAPYLTEACAGRCDDGETGEACIRREAMEEMGLRLGALEPVARTWTAPTVSTERLDLYLAAYGPADRVAEGGGAPGEHEDIEVVETPLAALWRAALAGEVSDLKTLALVYALQARRPALFQPG